MKPDDILNAIGDVDDTYIRKAHQKSFLKALAFFMIIVIVGVTIMYRQLPDFHLQLRYNSDGTVISGYVEPETVIHNKWTSMEYTAYSEGTPTSTTVFQRRFNPDYRITHTENGNTTQIVGSNGDTLWPHDFLGDQHYANLYISTIFSTDLIGRIDKVYVNSEAAYGILNQQLNSVSFEYLERSNFILRQILYKSGGTPEETIIGSRGYDYHINQFNGWKEWNSEGNLLAYAEYSYDGNTQTVASYLADGTLTGTRVTQYSFGKLKWREYYNPQGTLIGKEVYRYRFWEPFLCIHGACFLFVIISLAATVAFGIWDDRIKFGDRLVFIRNGTSKNDTVPLSKKMDELKILIEKLSEQLDKTGSSDLHEEISALTTEMKDMNKHLSELINGKPTDQ